MSSFVRPSDCGPLSTPAADAATSLLNARLGDAETLLRTPPPAVTPEVAARIASEHFGLGGPVRLLSGERDRNFMLGSPDGARHVLKFCNPVDDAQIRAMQNGVLLHVEAKDPGCPLPRLVRTRSGAEEVVLGAAELGLAGDDEIAAVVITCLPGANPLRSQISAEQRSSVGAALGRLSVALADYDHPCLDRAILWDMMNVGDLGPLASMIEDGAARRSVEAWLERFEDQIAGPAAALAQQPIHNDSSLSNLMVDPAVPSRITGVIDFGDIVRAPRINDLAIAGSYFVPAGEEPGADSIDLAQAFAEIITGIAPEHRAHFALDERAIALFPGLVQARLATRILLSGWRARMFPENRDYIMRSNQAAWGLWHRMDTPQPQEIAARLQDLTLGER